MREYERNGERVRYYSVERGAWEELPASMVDWVATAKSEAEMEKESTALVAKVHKQEEGRRMDNVTDIDASLPVGEGAFLPSGEGMFVVEGKSIRILDQVGSAVKTDKMRVIGQVLSPVHMVPGKQTIEIQGARAVLRLKTTNPEFYLREAPPDTDHMTTIEQSGRANEVGAGRGIDSREGGEKPQGAGIDRHAVRGKGERERERSARAAMGGGAECLPVYGGGDACRRGNMCWRKCCRTG